jgi:hypothetical protein
MEVGLCPVGVDPFESWQYFVEDWFYLASNWAKDTLIKALVIAVFEDENNQIC